MNSLHQETQKLGLRRAKHLLRRASFAYSAEILNEFAELTPDKAFSKLIEKHEIEWSEPYDPLPKSNPDGNWTSSTKHPKLFDKQKKKKRIVTSWWWYNSINKVSLKGKLTFFLHTSFTVAKDQGAAFSTHFYDHLRLLEYFSFGNLKTLAKKITFDNSMLAYLDNTENNATNPNENYAREFLELFTILKGSQKGNGDYTTFTEHDVQETARVFSGVKTKLIRDTIDIDTNLPKGRILASKHATRDKVFSAAFNHYKISGKSNEEEIEKELDEFVEMIFSKDATAISFCRKIYRYFVKSEWDDSVETDIIVPLSQKLKKDNYEIIPTLRKLLTSKHFYDSDDTNSTDEIVGSIIKSPLQLISETISFFKLDIPHPMNEKMRFYKFFEFIHDSFLKAAGMPLWNPDSVAGYPAHYQEPDFDRHWFSSNTVLARYKMIECLIDGYDKIGKVKRIPTNLDLPNFVKENIKNPSNAIDLVTELSDFLYCEEIDDQRKKYFAENLLEGFADFYWTNAWLQYEGSGNDTVVKTRLNALITRMINAPEFQLM